MARPTDERRRASRTETPSRRDASVRPAGSSGPFGTDDCSSIERLSQRPTNDRVLAGEHLRYAVGPTVRIR